MADPAAIIFGGELLRSLFRNQKLIFAGCFPGAILSDFHPDSRRKLPERVIETEWPV